MGDATNGGVSKASKTLHVSEDIFGGANVMLRGGFVEYTEFIHCGKARDITFSGINHVRAEDCRRQRAGSACRATCRASAPTWTSSGCSSLYTTSIGFFVTATILHTA